MNSLRKLGSKDDLYPQFMGHFDNWDFDFSCVILASWGILQFQSRVNKAYWKPKKSINDKNGERVVGMDLPNSFKRIPRDLLVAKLHAYGLLTLILYSYRLFHF